MPFVSHTPHTKHQHGDVSTIATAYAGHEHGARPAWYHGRARPNPFGPLPEHDGNLRVRSVRADLTLRRVPGQIDVENDFGKMTWLADAPPGKHDHRIVSQDGPIEVRPGKSARGALPLTLYSECGIVHLAPGANEGLEESSFASSSGDDLFGLWHGFVNAGVPNAHGFELFDHIAAALHGRPRKPEFDIISRAEAIRLPPAQRRGAAGLLGRQQGLEQSAPVIPATFY